MIPVVKAHAYGNDFLYVDEWNALERDRVALARAICDRHTGIGADGLILYRRTPDGAKMRLLNADGSHAEVSGNGVRGLAALLIDVFGFASADGTVRVHTDAGEKTLTLVGREGRRPVFRAEMGQPAQLARQTLEIAGEPVGVVTRRPRPPPGAAPARHPCACPGGELRPHHLGQSEIHWLQDPFGNHVAHVSFKEGTRQEVLEVRVELAVDVRPVNPFDFFVDDRCKTWPFTYPGEFLQDLSPFLASSEDAEHRPMFARFLKSLPGQPDTVDEVVALNRPSTAPCDTSSARSPASGRPRRRSKNGRGSCRDSAVLLIAALAARGFAARFASGYLIQLTDEGMIPDEPKGVGRDVVDLHAWAEVFLPGGGWIGLDRHERAALRRGPHPACLHCSPALATPLEGTSDRRRPRSRSR